MSLTLRPGKPEDAAMCGVICYEAFKTSTIFHRTIRHLRLLWPAWRSGCRIRGYATVISAAGHAVGETTEAVQALIGAAPTFERGGFLVPWRNGELFRWCLSTGFRVAVPQTLMSQGFSQEPVGAFLPSVLY